ncbi:6-phosphogluconolactonase [Spiribacter roseus]|uniref:6-phosphogluconolactonase n=1 Tax=Spiribacter roseus TaxID=1855875 RepID=A0ABV3RX39_9GAMM
MKSADQAGRILAAAQRFPTPARAASALADRLTEVIDHGAQRRDRASLLVPGGRTPVALFEALCSRDLQWDRVHVSLTDERRVAADDPASNAAMVRAHLIQDRAAAAHFHPLYQGHTGDRGDEAACSAALGLLPRPFDAVVLGMGGDGHIASIFPDDPALPRALSTTTESRCVVTRAPDPPHDRLSLTLMTLLQSRWIALHVNGASKWATLEQAIATADPQRYPVYALLSQRRVPVHVYYSA